MAPDVAGACRAGQPVFLAQRPLHVVPAVVRRPRVFKL